ncbi:pilus assembly protein CpaE [Sphingomonas sp. H39-1-10]|uniref:AAA family ATPase n=1 Tax=Sphingomonas pollutisoli TaxID=3030829 RepID=UPI0023B8EB48|nr:pilus assembly protein CpaE [Sphingomonas pollutisoli]MDF0488483.1 pilus assembly protein CpaE [Sphingomonas pollutisoli]
MNAPFNPGKIGFREPFVAHVCDEQTAETIRAVASDMGWAEEKVSKGGLRNAVQSLSVQASPQILLIDLSESGDPLNDINALAEVCEPGTVVIATGQVNDVRLYRDLIASGIQDYLLKPLSPAMLREALTHAQSVFNAPRAIEDHGGRPHCATAFIGARGGVGASTLATSVAWLISERGPRNTAILDLDVHFGTGALALDLEPGRGLTDAIENPSRIDGLFIERAMVKASETLSVLSAEAPINAPVLTDGAAFHLLQEEMRLAFECTVVDLPRAMLVQHPQLVAGVQAAVIVTELTLAAARDTIRILSWLKSNAPASEVIIVANRVPPAAQLEISRKDFEGSIERKIDHFVPLDQKLAAQAAKLGKTLAEIGKASKTTAPLAEIAARILATGETESGAPRGKGKAGGASLFAKMGALTAMMPKRGDKAKQA